MTTQRDSDECVAQKGMLLSEASVPELQKMETA